MMSSMRKITTSERRNRLGRRHLLADQVDTPVEAADAMVVLHATDPATIYLSALSRLRHPSIDAVNQSLFVERSLVRMLAMRRTLFVASRSVLPLIQQSSSVDVAARERRVLIKALERSGISNGEQWIAAAEREIIEALGDGGLSARELTGLVPRLETRIVVGSGNYTQETGATSRTLGVLGAEGSLVRANRPEVGPDGCTPGTHAGRGWVRNRSFPIPTLQRQLWWSDGCRRSVRQRSTISGGGPDGPWQSCGLRSAHSTLTR